MRYSVNSRPSNSMWWIIFSFPGDTWLIVSVYRKIRRSHIIVMLDIRHFSVLPVTSKFARHTMLNTLMILQPFEVEKEREWIKFQSSSPHSVTNNLYNLGFSDCAIKWWAWLIYYLNFQAYWKDSHKSTCDKHKMQGPQSIMLALQCHTSCHQNSKNYISIVYKLLSLWNLL